MKFIALKTNDGQEKGRISMFLGFFSFLNFEFSGIEVHVLRKIDEFYVLVLLFLTFCGILNIDVYIL